MRAGRGAAAAGRKAGEEAGAGGKGGGRAGARELAAQAAGRGAAAPAVRVRARRAAPAQRRQPQHEVGVVLNYCMSLVFRVQVPISASPAAYLIIRPAPEADTSKLEDSKHRSGLDWLCADTML